MRRDPPDQPDHFTVTAYGSTIPGIELYAVDHAMKCYGPAARLRVVHVGAITEARSPQAPGRLMANVVVRCLNYDEALESQRRHVAEVTTAKVLTQIGEFLTDVRAGEYDPATGYGGLPERVPQWPG
jgi:hypothetical protein